MSEPFAPSRVRGVLFDVDGTLLDSDDAWADRIASWITPLRRWLPSLQPAKLARWMVMRIERPMNFAYNIWDWLHLDEITRPLFRAVGSRLPRRSAPRPIADTLATLAQLQGQFALAVVTARGNRRARQLLSDTGLLTFFNVLISSDRARRGKPHPAPVLMAAEELGLAPAECLMVGDTPPDIIAGVRAGAQTAAVLSGFGERDELEAAGANLVLASIRDLPAQLVPAAGEASIDQAGGPGA